MYIRTKALILAFAVVAAVPCIAQQVAQTKDDSPREQMRRLLDGFPPGQALSRYQNVVRHPKTSTDKDELTYAREQVKLVQERVPKIRALLKPGTSIFDYPGLLAKARIVEYGPCQLPDGTFEDGYRLYFGVFLAEAAEQGTEPWDFNVFVNERGIITAVKGVVWKR